MDETPQDPTHDHTREHPPAPPEEATVALLPPDVRLTDVTHLRHPEAIEVWNGVVWSRLGRGDLAWAWWDGVESDELAAWVAAERGRVVRELGLHTAAERFDSAGLEVATDVIDICMLRLGLTADAIGKGDLELAHLRLSSVEPMLDRLPHSPRLARQRMRCSWIHVEIAFLAGQSPPVDLLPWWTPEEGIHFPELYDHGSDFHRAKGLLFGGIAREDGRLLDAAADMAPPVLRWAIELARDDRQREGALRLAREAWKEIVPPPGFQEAVGRTDTADRLSTQRKPIL